MAVFARSSKRPDPRLRVISKPVGGVDDDVRTLVADMFETMYDAPGIGLAAIQVGVPQRILVIDLQEEEDEEGKPVRDPRVFINPEILDPADEQQHSITRAACRFPINMPRSIVPPRAARAGSIWTASSMTSASKACWRRACSTRWITLRASCSSITSAA